jgi:hypothetical protein
MALYVPAVAAEKRLGKNYRTISSRDPVIPGSCLLKQDGEDTRDGSTIVLIEIFIEVGYRKSVVTSCLNKIGYVVIEA